MSIKISKISYFSCFKVNEKKVPWKNMVWRGGGGGGGEGKKMAGGGGGGGGGLHEKFCWGEGVVIR